MRSTTLLFVLAMVGLIGSASAACTLSTTNLCQTAATQTACLSALTTYSSCISKNCAGLTDLTKLADCYGTTCKSDNEEVSKFYTDYANCIRPAGSSALTIQTISAAVLALFVLLLA